MLGQSQCRQWLISYEYTCTASKTQKVRSFDRFFLCAGEKLWWIWCITRSAHLPPICSTCQCFVKVRMQKCCHVCIGANKILKNEGGKKPVKVLAYLCSAVVFVHICVIFPGWVADSSWVPNAVSTPPTQQLIHYNSLHRLTFQKWPSKNMLSVHIFLLITYM